MERAARKASETKDAERRTACAAKVANKHRKEAERVVEEVVEVPARNGLLVQRTTRGRRNRQTQKSRKKKAAQVH